MARCALFKLLLSKFLNDRGTKRCLRGSLCDFLTARPLREVTSLFKVQYMQALRGVSQRDSISQP